MLGATAAACCGGNDVGLEFDGGLQIGDSVADVKVVRMPKRNGGAARPGAGGGFMQRVTDAIQNAVHPDSGPGVGGDGYNVDGGGSYASSAQVVPFPVVSPYRPLTATRVPIEGLTAFPKSGYYFNGEPVSDFNVEGDDPNENMPPGFETLQGFPDPGANAPVGIGLSQENYSPLGMKWEGVIGQIVQGVPGIISAGKSQPYYDPSQSSNPQLFPQQVYGEGVGVVGPGGAGANIGSQAGAAVGNIGDTISNIVSQNPLLVLGLGAAALLLFMRPPGRR